jgi:hypothetical protein
VRDQHLETAIETAKRLGTYGKLNRAKQYEKEIDADEIELRKRLLRNDNLLFEKVRRVEELRFWHRLGLVLIASAIARLPELIALLRRLL